MRLKPVILWALLLILPGLGGCATVSYYLQAVNGQMDVLGRARPIQTVIDDPATTTALKKKLDAVRRIREFASHDLGLPDNGTFRTYADLERPYVVWNVFAAPEFSIQPKEWCYPFAGCAHYRGYFSKTGALAEADELRQQGYDVYVGGVSAYSTLGWFDDPVLNTFIRYPLIQLAPLVFHELAHQVVYVPDDSVFNESFATAVELEGMHRWLAKEGNASERAAFDFFEKRRQAFTALVGEYREKLAALYATALPDEEKRAEKAKLFREMRADYEGIKAQWGGFSGYDHWFAQDLNNAQLASVSLYAQMVPAFQALLARHHGDLKAFYQAVRKLGGLPKAERLAALQPSGSSKD